MANVDAKKFNAVAEQFRGQMGDAGSAGAGPGTGADGTGGASGASEASGEDGQQNPLDKVYDILNEYVTTNDLTAQIELTNTDNYVKIRIKDTLMFVPDSPALLADSQPIIENIAKAIAQVSNEVDFITFSGHTADIGSNNLNSDQISWRLSTERAITVLNDFIIYGVKQDKLSIQGFAHFSPIADNSTAEGRGQNRRVEITIYKYPTDDKSQFAQDITATQIASSSSASESGSSVAVSVAQESSSVSSAH